MKSVSSAQCDRNGNSNRVFIFSLFHRSYICVCSVLSNVEKYATKRRRNYHRKSVYITSTTSIAHTHSLTERRFAYVNKTHNCNGFCAVKWQNLLWKRKTHLAFKEATISLSLSIQFVDLSQCFDRPNQDDRPVVCRSIVVNLPWVIITKSAFVCTTIFLLHRCCAYERIYACATNLFHCLHMRRCDDCDEWWSVI